MPQIPHRSAVPRSSTRTALAVGAAVLATGVFLFGAATRWGAGAGEHASHTVADVMGDLGLAAAARACGSVVGSGSAKPSDAAAPRGPVANSALAKTSVFAASGSGSDSDACGCGVG